MRMALGHLAERDRRSPAAGTGCQRHFRPDRRQPRRASGLSLRRAGRDQGRWRALHRRCDRQGRRCGARRPRRRADGRHGSGDGRRPAAPRARLDGGTLLRRAAQYRRRRDRHQRQDLGRRLCAPDLGDDGLRRCQHRHRRGGLAVRQPGARPHHPRSRSPPRRAGRARRGRREPRGARGFEPRSRPVAARRRQAGSRRLHQPDPRPSRLPSDLRGLCRGQAAALHRGPARRRRRP